MRYFSLLLIFSALWLTTATNSHFSQDSWSYYELSRHIFDDFYRINSWRQYHIVSDYGVSFPPLWPILIACVNALIPLGIYAGFVLNFIIAALTFPLLRRLSKIWFGNREIGCLIFFALMITPDYTTALFSASTLPLALLFLLLMLYLYAVKRYIPLFKATLLGITAGLGVLTRFDLLLPALLAGLFLRPFRGTARYYYSTLLIALAPWMAYSLSHFNALWISDNSRTLLSSIPIFVRDYYPDGVALIWHDPLGWMVKTTAAMIRSADSMFTATSALPWLLGAILFITRQPQINKNILFFGMLIVAQISIVLLTGFVETRYYVPLQLFLLVALLWLALPPKVPTIFTQSIPAVFLMLSLLYAGAYFAKSAVQGAPIAWQFNAENQKPEEFSKLLNCMKTKGSILLPPKNYSYKFGALTGITSYIEPTNMNRQNVKPFLGQFKPAYLLTDKPRLYGMSSPSLCTIEGWGESEETYRLYKF